MTVRFGIETQLNRRARVLLAVLAAFVFDAPLALAQSTTQNTSSTTLAAPAASKRRGLVKASWNLAITGDGYSDEQQQAQTTGLGLNGKLDYRFLPMLELKAAAGVSMQSGYAQSRFGDNTPSSGVTLQEAVVVFKPIRAASVSAGAIDQGHLSSPLLVSSQPFPGAKERVIIGSRDFNVELKAQQTIPTSKTLSTKAVEAEVTPSFTTETLALRSAAIPSVELLGYGTHFAFRSLPSNVALESERYGNSITMVSANRGRFTYEFDGYVAGGEARVAIANGFKVSFEGQVLQNTKADQSYGSGQYIGSALEIALPGDVDLKPKAGTFFAESDVAPGFYNSAAFGHNNRTGWTAGLEAIFKQAGFKIGGDYVSSELINASTLQSRMSYIQLRFETLYDVL